MPPPEDFSSKLTEALTRSLKGLSNIPDPETREEEEDLQKQHFRTIIHGLEQDIEERKKYAKFFFVLACFWLGAITGLLLLQGFGPSLLGSTPFKLADTVILAVIGSTTVNVLGILYVVATYLFPKRHP
jgi:hypothetical protein